jgi:ATP-dependent exoDNAse (exonuclease V) beta subunit
MPSADPAHPVQSGPGSGSPGVADAQQRRAALDPARSFIVQAPAGSGKTGLLIQRYLVVLARSQAPEEVLAITFTRKAAAEMRTRVLQAVEAARRGLPAKHAHEALTFDLAGEVLRRDAERGWEIEANPGRLRIMTIDALCATLTRRMPLLSGLGPVAAMEGDARELYREAARATLDLLDDAVHGDAVAALLQHLDNDFDAAAAMLARLLQRREQWLRTLGRGRVSREAVERALVNLARERMARAAHAAPSGLGADLVAAVRYSAGNLLAAGSTIPGLAACAALTSLPGSGIGDLSVWRYISDLLLTATDHKLRKAVDVDLGFPPASGARGVEKALRDSAKAAAKALLVELAAHEPFVRALRAIRELPEPVYDARQWAFIESLGNLLPVALAQLKVVFQARGTVDFVETTLRAIQALGEPEAPTDLALALDYRIHHLLIDEFQDTSYSHFELLQRLTAGWQRGDGRTLFLVGDPMQSINRFREAEVSLFLRVREQGIGELMTESLRLEANFRSQQGVVDWVNQVFPSVLAQIEDLAAGAVTYAPCVATHPALPGAGVEVHALIGDEANREPGLVVDLVRRAQADDPAGSIGLLVRSRPHLAQIVPALTAAGIRFRAIEIESLEQRPVVRDLHALTRALVHPADRTAWLAVLRAPWCGLTLADLEVLAGVDASGTAHGTFDRTLLQLMRDPVRLARMSEDGRGRLAALCAALEPVLDARGRGALRRRVEGAWLRLGGPACARDEVDLDDAQVFLALLDTLERGGDLEDLRALDERLESLYALPDVQAGDRVQVMTIHKSKGLEFDSVIVAGLARGQRSDDAQLLQWIERPGPGGEPELLLAAVTGRGRDTDAVYRCIGALHQQRQREEDGRLLYVAVTRAKRRAHLIGSARRDEKTAAPVAPRSDALLARLWPALAPHFEAAAQAARCADGADVAAPAAASPAALRRLRAGWQLPPAPAPVPWRQPVLAPDRQAPGIEFSWAGESARHVGTVVHRFLQQIAQDGLERWDDRPGRFLEAVARTALRTAGVPEAELGKALARVQQALRGALADARARWVLGAHALAQAELRLTAALEGQLVHVAVDRTFVAEDGTRWIVDYKTGEHEGGDLEGFLDREQERYREQLERYARIMTRLDGRPVRVALYFPLLQAWREWAPPAAG